MAKNVYGLTERELEVLDLIVEGLTNPEIAYGLTERELDVLELMVEGLSNPQIADKLVITRATAKAHVHSILQKLCVTNRAKAINKVKEEKLV